MILSEVKTTREEFTPAELANLADQWFKAFNRHDTDGLVALYTEDAKHYSPKLKDQRPDTQGMIHGGAALRAWWQDAFDRIPSLRYEPLRVTVQENRIAVEYLRYSSDAEAMSVAEFYEVVRAAGEVRIAISRVYHG